MSPTIRLLLVGKEDTSSEEIPPTSSKLVLWSSTSADRVEVPDMVVEECVVSSFGKRSGCSLICRLGFGGHVGRSISESCAVMTICRGVRLSLPRSLNSATASSPVNPHALSSLKRNFPKSHVKHVRTY